MEIIVVYYHSIFYLIYMSLLETVHRDRVVAMKEKSERRLSVLRMLAAAIKNEEIEKRGAIDDAAVVAIISRQVKQTKDARTDFVKSGREDLVAQADEELAILSSYLPEQMLDEELQSIVLETIQDLGASSLADSGKVMGAVMGKVKGKADGNRVKEIVGRLLN